MNEAAPAFGTAPPLYVDLDGTLIKSDLFLESLFALLKAKPLCILLLPLWLLRGRAYLKAEIARRVTIDPASFIYEERLLDRLREERARGRRIVLATASDRHYAEAMARYLGVFDAVLASDGTRNLKSHRKLEAIKADAAGQAFDYAGNESADFPIWKEARRALVVNAPASVLRKARSLTTAEAIEPSNKPYPLLIFKAVRIHQWLKNVLIFLPVLAAHRADSIPLDIKAVEAFVAFGLTASSIYVLNDLSDLASDRQHPRKRNRPFASGALPLSHGLALIPLLLGLSLLISVRYLPPAFWAVLGLYYISSLTYNFLAKDQAIFDVIMLAGLYAVRVLAGTAATDVVPSYWLLAFSMFMFLSLALVKRYAEMLTMQKLGKHEAYGRGYETGDMPLLESMGIASGYLAVLVMALYINSPDVHIQYAHPKSLWAICPLILFWVSRTWLKTHRAEMHDDPVVFAARDTLSLAIAIACLACLLIAGPI